MGVRQKSRMSPFPLWGPEVPEQAEGDAASSFGSLIVASLFGGNAKKARVAWNSVQGSLPEGSV